MAPKTLSKHSKVPKEKEEKEQHPPPQVQEDDGDDVEEDESEEEDEEEEEHPKQNKPDVGSDSGSDSDSGSGSGSGSDASPSPYTMQPIPKPIPLTTATKVKRPNTEISNGQESSKGSKKQKPCPKEIISGSGSVPVSTSTPGSAAFVRVWSNEDEINILKGMTDFKNKKGVDPNTEFAAFYESVKGKFQGDYSKEQLRSKSKNMKKRFLNAIKRSEDGSDPVFSKPHDDLVFELSKKVWDASIGTKGDANSVHDTTATKITNTPKKDTATAKKNSTSSKKDAVSSKKDLVSSAKKDSLKEDKALVSGTEKHVEEGSFWSKYPFLSASFDDGMKNYSSTGFSDAEIGIVKDNLSLVGSEKAKDLEAEWKQLLMEKMELTHKMSALMREQIKIVFNLMNQQ